MIGYNLIRYYRDRYVRKPKDKVSKVLNDIIFYSCIFINVELFIVAYYIGLNYFLVVFVIIKKDNVFIKSNIVIVGNGIFSHTNKVIKTISNKRVFFTIFTDYFF